MGKPGSFAFAALTWQLSMTHVPIHLIRMHARPLFARQAASAIGGAAEKAAAATAAAAEKAAAATAAAIGGAIGSGGAGAGSAADGTASIIMGSGGIGGIGTCSGGLGGSLHSRDAPTSGCAADASEVAWRWVDEWAVDSEGSLTAGDGWQYALNWNTGWLSSSNPITHVRRRRWVRSAEAIAPAQVSERVDGGASNACATVGETSTLLTAAEGSISPIGGVQVGRLSGLGDSSARFDAASLLLERVRPPLAPRRTFQPAQLPCMPTLPTAHLPICTCHTHTHVHLQANAFEDFVATNEAPGGGTLPTADSGCGDAASCVTAGVGCTSRSLPTAPPAAPPISVLGVATTSAVATGQSNAAVPSVHAAGWARPPSVLSCHSADSSPLLDATQPRQELSAAQSSRHSPSAELRCSPSAGSPTAPLPGPSTRPPHPTGAQPWSIGQPLLSSASMALLQMTIAEGARMRVSLGHAELCARPAMLFDHLAEVCLASAGRIC